MVDEMELERLRAIEDAARREQTGRTFPDMILAGMDLRALLGCPRPEDEERRPFWEAQKQQQDRAHMAQLARQQPPVRERKRPA